MVRASPFDLEADAASLTRTQGLNTDDVEEAFTDAGYVGSYLLTHELRDEDTADPADPPVRENRMGAYAFETAAGAEAGYELIADEGANRDAEDVDGAVAGLGDEAELTVVRVRRDPGFRSPGRQAELEILLDRLVLEVSVVDFGAEAAEVTTLTTAETETVAALGERLVERGEEALDGDAPPLGRLVVAVESEVEEVPFLAYDLIDGEPVRFSSESPEAFEARVEGQLDRGTVGLLRSAQVLTGPDADVELHLFNTVLSFEDEEAGSAYMAGLVDRLAEVPANVSVEAVANPELGDESTVLSFLREDADGEPYTVLQLFVRVGDTVGVLLVDQPGPVTDSPEVPLDGLIPLGEAQVACFEAGACEGPVPAPVEVAEAIAAASTG